jgi:hypothetical protein
LQAARIELRIGAITEGLAIGASAGEAPSAVMRDVVATIYDQSRRLRFGNSRYMNYSQLSNPRS